MATDYMQESLGVPGLFGVPGIFENNPNLAQVKYYIASWEPKKSNYGILIWVEANQSPLTLPVNSETEFSSILLILGKKGVMIDTQTGLLFVPPRPVGT